MPQANEPPPSSTALAAAGGGFVGAVVGVIAATMLMGDGNNADSDARLKAAPAAEVVVAKE